MQCNLCGASIAAGTRFCPSCGGEQPVVATPPRPAGLSPPLERPLPQVGTPVATVTGEPPTSSLAVASLISGVAAYLGFTVFTAIVAIITGHMARKEIRLSNGQMGGDGLALAGLILGYGHFALICLAVTLILTVFGGIASLLR